MIDKGPISSIFLKAGLPPCLAGVSNCHQSYYQVQEVAIICQEAFYPDLGRLSGGINNTSKQDFKMATNIVILDLKFFAGDLNYSGGFLQFFSYIIVRKYF